MFVFCFTYMVFELIVIIKAQKNVPKNLDFWLFLKKSALAKLGLHSFMESIYE